MTTQNLTLTPRERDTLLAALRCYQFYRMQGHPFDPKADHLIDIIAATSGEALDVTEIDDLCASLGGNKHALGVASRSAPQSLPLPSSLLRACHSVVRPRLPTA